MSEVTPEQVTPLVDAAVLLAEEPDDCGCGTRNWNLPDDASDPYYAEPLISLDVDGITYVGDPQVLVRRDVLTPLPDDLITADRLYPTAWATVPPERPPVSVRGQSIRNLDRITRAGLTLHDDDDTSPVVHLYSGDHHVGWTRTAYVGEGVGVLELINARAAARVLGVTVTRAHRIITELKALNLPGLRSA